MSLINILATVIETMCMINFGIAKRHNKLNKLFGSWYSSHN